jgi:hypothetical protein
MTMSNDETRETLKALDKLICVAERLGLADPVQRAALKALRGRRAVLQRTLAAHHELQQRKIVGLAAWRDAPLAGRRRGAAVVL